MCLVNVFLFVVLFFGTPCSCTTGKVGRRRKKEEAKDNEYKGPLPLFLLLPGCFPPRFPPSSPGTQFMALSLPHFKAHGGRVRTYGQGKKRGGREKRMWTFGKTRECGKCSFYWTFPSFTPPSFFYGASPPLCAHATYIKTNSFFFLREFYPFLGRLERRFWSRKRCLLKIRGRKGGGSNPSCAEKEAFPLPLSLLIFPLQKRHGGKDLLHDKSKNEAKKFAAFILSRKKIVIFFLKYEPFLFKG